jgi:tRNA (cytidine/uridine-2'-O-)-methyltransferase
MFGAETTGLPEVAHDVACKHGHIVKIPMKNSQHVRSLNLATSVGIGVFEALRQLDGPS